MRGFGKVLQTRKKGTSGPREKYSRNLNHGMAYQVSITSRAERDLDYIYERINAESSGAALKWYLGLKLAILHLGEHPNRGAVTRRKDKLRQLLYGNKPHIYRVIFRVVEKQQEVEVIHIRHGARGKLKPSDVA
jgi:toxin ParE1/3/4